VKTNSVQKSGSRHVNDGIKLAKKDFMHIRESLKKKPRDLLLFDLITMTDCPIKLLLKLTIESIRNVSVGERIIHNGTANDTYDIGLMNDTIYKTVRKCLKDTSVLDDGFLFKSRKGSGPLLPTSVSRIVKGWLKDAEIQVLVGAMSLRKEWQYHFDTMESKTSDSDTKKDDNILQQVKVATIQQTVFEELERAIVSGHLKPGKKLVIEEVSRQMGVSRIPIREAFGRLEAGGFITTLPKKGSFVNELSIDRFEEIIEIRLVIEAMISRRAALNRSEETIQTLEKLQKEYILAQEENDADRLLSVNKEFHFTLYRDANMPILMTIIEQLWSRISPYFYILWRETDMRNPQVDIGFHEDMLRAMKRRDSDAMVDSLKADLKDGWQLIQKWFSQY